ncbi:RNase A-like domain-containing protein [Metabacillus arenae]|uniref:WXG100 family type VII secretion target n=1 Tax=Metabacillus arenae TaxID=2771434 RepID=A0A926NKC1_9BACI|nr:RNase A-like domain-containing protein [Metabacillus arenae]MBD1381548.1 WXG100 family type VII secretion target [Metabacillus arenae]
MRRDYLRYFNTIKSTPEQAKAIVAAISDSYERDMVNGDTYSRAHWVTYALGTVVTSVVGTKGAGAVTKTGAVAAKTAATTGVTKTTTAANQLTLTDFLPNAPQHQLATVGGVPCNVVEGVGLRDHLLNMIKPEKQEVSVPRESKSSNDVPKGIDNIKQGDKSSLVPGGGLAAHELKGGHLIERHVGKTDEELLERLKSNPKITGSSTFKDRMTAEKVADTALINPKNIEKIQKWLSDPNSRPTLLLRYKGDGEIIGRSVSRNSEVVENVTNAKIVLKKDNNGSFILTGYPVK